MAFGIVASMNLFECIATLAAERLEDSKKHGVSPSRSTLVAAATESVFCHLETEIDAGRMVYGDNDACRRDAEFICDGYGLKLDEIL